MPPYGEHAWQEEFGKYQQTPEFALVNHDMTLEQYKLIFYIEWFHRLLARSAGLVYALPVFFFLFTRRIPWREFGIYFAMGSLFILQAFAGWFMVASGLVDRPSVSHYLLTVHLFLALSLFGLSLWTAFGHRYGFPARAKFSLPSKLALGAFTLLVVQIAYGGLTAGLKAGWVSNTWPLMFGRLVPADLVRVPLDILELPHTVMFIHRWFAWTGLLAIPAVRWVAKKRGFPNEITNGLVWLTGFAALQIALGIWTVTSQVSLLIALMHQANAIILFALGIYFIHRLRARDADAAA
jgi:cytochrome c oxidase assembly protein subunit 15